MSLVYTNSDMPAPPGLIPRLDAYLKALGLENDPAARIAVTRVWARELGFSDVNTALRGKFPGIAYVLSQQTPPLQEEEAAVEDEQPAEPTIDLSDIKFTGEPYWYESAKDTMFLEDFIEKRKTEVVNLLIKGPAGSGKTQGIYHLADRLNIPLFVMNCAVITNIDQWVGSKEVTPERGTFFQGSEHLRHLEADGVPPGIMLYDEINRMTPDVANFWLPLLDDQAGVWSPVAGRKVTLHPDNIIIATMNEGAGYTGTYTQDWALRDRFGWTLEREFPPELEEIRILVTRTGIDPELAQQIVRVCDQSRNTWAREEIDTPISTRAAIFWAMAVVSGKGRTVREAADYSVLPLYNGSGGSESDRSKIMMMLDGKVVDGSIGDSY